MMRKHALLAPSAAARWMVCAPSARLEETLPEPESKYADEGTLAHSVAELYAKKYLTDPMGPKKFKAALEKLQADPLYQPEMLGHVDTYLDYLKKIAHGFKVKPHSVIEKQLNISNWVPDCFSYSDCVMIGEGRMYVVDFKYGQGVPVSAENNAQMMIYALGALGEYEFLYQVKTVILAIAQPRLDSISEWEISVEDLLDWGLNELKQKAELAFAGEGEYVSGAHCGFCRAKALCAARADFNLMLEMDKGKKPPLLTHDELGDILVRAKDVSKWLNDLIDYAEKALFNGEAIKGWKLVEGRSVRKLDTDKAFKVLNEKGYDEAVLYTRQPITLTETEKLIGKTSFNDWLSPFVTKPPGKPTLVEQGDPRKEFVPLVSADEDFNKKF